MFEFDFQWIFILLPVPVLIHFIFPTHREPRQAIGIPFMERLSRLTGREPAPGSTVAKASFFQQILIVISWLLVITALARPQWVQEPITKTLPSRDLLLAVDLSGSMEAEDFTDPQGRKTDRLTAVKQVLDEFLTRRKGDRVGLILFGSAPFVQAPFTDDLDVVRTLMEEAQVRMAGPQTMMGDAIGLALNLFEKSETQERVLIVLTDGNDTDSQVPPRKAAEIARDKAITIHTVAVGDPQSVGEEKLDEETLKAMSEITGGSYFHAMDRKQLEDIYRKLDELETQKIETISHRPKQDLFFYPLAAFLLIGLLYHLLTILKKTVPESNSRGVTRSKSYVFMVAFFLIISFFAVFYFTPFTFSTTFHFIRPWFLIALVPVVLIIWFIKNRQNAQLLWRDFISDHLLKHLLVGQYQQGRVRPWHLLTAVWCLTVISISGPTWRQEPAPFAEDKAALFIVLKVTSSMKAGDIQPSRLERSVHKISDILALRKGALNGLIAYSGSAHLVMPLTRDDNIVKTFAAELSPEIMPTEGEALAEALSLANKRLKKSGLPGSILVIADGITQNQINILTKRRKGGDFPAHILAVASETPTGNPPAPALDRGGLKRTANSLGGTLTVVTADTGDVKRIVSRIESALQTSEQYQEGQRWQDYGYWLVPVIVVLSLMWFRPGWVVQYD